MALVILGYAVVSCTHPAPRPSPQPTPVPTLPVFVSPTQPAYKPSATVPAPVAGNVGSAGTFVGVAVIGAGTVALGL